MRNPDSFQLKRILEMPKGAMCYDYRAQNGFGGMNVDHAVLVNGTLKSDDASWSRSCAGRTGRDVTAKVQEIIDYVRKHS